MGEMAIPRMGTGGKVSAGSAGGSRSAEEQKGHILMASTQTMQGCVQSVNDATNYACQAVNIAGSPFLWGGRDTTVVLPDNSTFTTMT